MNKSMLLAATLLLSSSAAFAADFKQADNQWFKDGQATVKALMDVQPITKKAKNIILLIAGRQRCWHQLCDSPLSGSADGQVR